ncbi:MAG: hypothetical protein ACNS60_14015 [Candidatus Cyclobacteriaceae bacterium M2_1C_046]
MKSTFLRILGIAALCVLMTATYSCKSKKKAAEAEAQAEKERMERMEAEREAREAEEERRRREEEEAERRRLAEEEAKARAPYEKVSQYFNSIAQATSGTAADRSISEAMNMFASGDVPVLIIIYENEAENVTDYDEPTTIDKYLHYLKTVKRTPDNVEEMKFNDQGKITELILKKK